jgi:hypothetical protein
MMKSEQSMIRHDQSVSAHGRSQAYTLMPQIFVETKQLYERSPALVLFLLYKGNLEKIVTSFNIFIRARDLPFGRVVLF